MPGHSKKLNCVPCGIIFCVFFFVYLKTVCPTVFWWDSGEFIANVATLGIAHRPSFPIYILLARVFTILPLGNFIFKVNLFSALCAALSLSYCYLVFVKLLKIYLPDYAKDKTVNILCGLTFLLLLGFTYSFWIQAVRAEVYALCFLFIVMVVFLILRYAQTGEDRYLFLSAFVFGLGLGNHHLILMSVLPALVLTVVCLKHEIRLSQTLLVCLLVLAGLSIYLYLPVRNISRPVLNWGNPKSLGNALSSVLALDALRKMGISSLYKVIFNFPKLLELIYNQLTPLGFMISILGLILAFRKSLKLALFVLALFIGNSITVLLVVSEFFADNVDLHGYLLPSMFALSLSVGMGLCIFVVETETMITRKARKLVLLRAIRILVLVFVVLVCTLPLVNNRSKADLSNNRLAESYVVEAVDKIEKASIIFIDNVNFDFIYRGLRYGAKFREDLVVVNRTFLPADWYFVQQNRLFPEVYQGVPPKLRGEGLFHELLKRCLAKKMVTCVEFTENDYNLSPYLIPHGAFFLVSKSPNLDISPGLLNIQKKWENDSFFGLTADKTIDDIDAQRNLVLWLYRQGLFYEHRGILDVAKEKFVRALEFDPENEELQRKIKRLQ